VSSLVNVLRMKTKKIQKKYYRKQVGLFALIRKIKLWPSRNGVLHGVKFFEEKGVCAEVTTHCNRRIIIRDSRRSRAARWLRNKWFSSECKECHIPRWKLEKFSLTSFNRHYGSQLR
jgi:pyrrolysyl-tRNA synthetase-like protein